MPIDLLIEPIMCEFKIDLYLTMVLMCAFMHELESLHILLIKDMKIPNILWKKTKMCNMINIRTGC